MRILFTIAHYFRSESVGADQPVSADGTPAQAQAAKDGAHGSTRKDPRPRIMALSAAILGLQQTFSANQCIIQIADRTARQAGGLTAHEIDVAVVTTGGNHVLSKLPISKNLYEHIAVETQPLTLGYECRAVMSERLGLYDYYCFLEDDIILSDPLFFDKLSWFTSSVGNDKLLQPNRFERSAGGPFYKAYIDGDLADRVVAPFADITQEPTLAGSVLGRKALFLRARNPHSGCYFLNAGQMERFAATEHFMDKSDAFVGPLESAATLGPLKTFAMYKPTPANACFLEVEHFGSSFIGLIGKQVRVPDRSSPSPQSTEPLTPAEQDDPAAPGGPFGPLGQAD